jgi:hypothetical protein
VGPSIKGGNNVARKGSPEKKQTDCVLTMRREGMAKQRDKLKELKHEGHIALGE